MFVPFAYSSLLGSHCAANVIPRLNRGLSPIISPAVSGFIDVHAHPASSPIRPSAPHNFATREILSSPVGLSSSRRIWSSSRLSKHVASPIVATATLSVPRFSVDHYIQPDIRRTPPLPRATGISSQQISDPAVSPRIPEISPGFRHREQSPTCAVRLDESSHPNKKRDAYDAFSSSPETQWSTLPASKKSKSRLKTSNGHSSITPKFRLPLSTPREPVAEGPRPRKTLYMPPPPAAANTSALSDGRPQHTASQWKVTRITLQDALKGLGRDLGIDKAATGKGGEGPHFCEPSKRLAITWRCMTAFINRLLLVSAQMLICPDGPLHHEMTARRRHIL